MPQSLTDKLGSMMRFWPAFLAAFLAFAGIMETRYRVQTLIDDKLTDEKQWERIADARSRITTIEQWKVGVDQVITPEGLQAWGRIQGDVARHERAIERLERRP